MLLPFIEETKLLQYVKPLEEELEGEDRQRNEFGDNVLFVHRDVYPDLAKLMLSATVKVNDADSVGFKRLQ